MSDNVYDMSDEDLEVAFRAAKAEQSNPTEVTDVSTENVDDVEEVDTEEADELDTSVEDDAPETDASKEGEENDGTEQLDDEQDSGPDVDDKTTEGEEADDKEATPKPEDASSTVRKFKANGKEYEISVKEMEEQFPKVFGQAMDYTKKMQAIAPWRKTIDAIEEAKLNHNDINLMIDVLKGDKAAIAEVLKRTSTDALDLTTSDTSYTPNDYGRDSRTLALHDVIDSIKTDSEYATTGRILSSEWDEASWNTLSAEPEKIRLLHNDVKSGVYAKVQRIAEKLKVFDGGRQTDLDYYMAGARQHFTELAATETRRSEATAATAQQDAEAAVQARVTQAKTQDARRKASAQAGQARKAAAPSASPTKAAGVVDYLDASEEDFNEWYNRINK